MTPIAALLHKLGNAADAFFEETRVTRHLVIPASLEGIQLPDPGSGINDRHIEDISAPGLIPGTGVLFFRVQHSGSSNLRVRMNNETVLQDHELVGESPLFFRFCIPYGLREVENVLTISVLGERSVVIRDVILMYLSTKLTVPVPPVFSPR